MLAAFAIARKVGKRAIGGRHGGVVLLDAAAHFRDQAVLQRNGGREHCVRVCVLVFEMLADRRIEHARVVHQLLPVGVP
jgi:hypothetical protein